MPNAHRMISAVLELEPVDACRVNGHVKSERERRSGRLAAVAAASMLAIAALGATSDPAAAQSPKQIWAFYLGFWAGPDAWDDASDILDDLPLQGKYDSRQSGVARGQIEQAQQAGIDAFVVSWRGTHDAAGTATLRTLLDEAQGRGFRVGAVLDHFEGGDAGRSQESLDFLLSDLANHPAYLHYRGKPVVMFAFQRALDWGGIRSRVDPGRRSLWISEGLKGEKLFGGAMDGMYAFNFAWSDGRPAMFARDRDAVHNGGGSVFIPTVHPGWDEQKVARRDGRPNPTSPRARDGGAFLRRMWEGAVSAGTDVILVVSWNEFIENSHVEPSQRYGTQSLDTLRPLAAAWKGSGPAVPPPGPPPDGEPGDLTAEGDARQLIQFNPGASLQKRIFADGFVPNSAEFDLDTGGARRRAQRAEHLGSGRVRVYHVVHGDWSRVAVAERGRAQDAVDRDLLAEGERRQLIQFNPGAALQKRIFADGFVPNSPEFSTTSNGRPYAAQRAEHLRSGEVRVYFAHVGDFERVRYHVRLALWDRVEDVLVLRDD